MKALFDDGRNLGLSFFVMVVIEEICLWVDAIFKFGLLENFFSWFVQRFAVGGAIVGLVALVGILGAVWLTILFIFHRFDVYNNVAAMMKRICSAKKSRGG